MVHGSSDITTRVGAIKSSWVEERQDFGERLRKKRESLRLTQEQMAKLLGVNQSTISRYETGGKSPKDYPTTKAVALCYRLDQTETSDLFRLTFGRIPYSVETFTSHGRSFDGRLEVATNKIVEFFHPYPREIRKLWREGKTEEALWLAGDSADLLEFWAMIDPAGESSQSLDLLRARLRFEQARVLRAIAKPETVVDETRSLVEEIHAVAKKYKNKEVGGLVSLSKADASYIKGDHATSLKFLNQALEFVKSPDDLLYVLRIMALDYGYLKQKGNLKEIEYKAKDIIEGKQFSDWHEVYQTEEGFGRAWGKLKSSKGFYCLDEVEKQVRNNQEGLAFIHIQLARSKLEIARSLTKADMVSLESECKDAIRFVGPKFPRHTEKIMQLLERTL